MRSLPQLIPFEGDGDGAEEEGGELGLVGEEGEDAEETAGVGVEADEGFLDEGF